MKVKAVSGTMLTLLLIGMLTLAFNIQPVKSDWTWTETIYIRADGSVDPDTAPISSVDNITYTLADNIVGDVPEWSSAIVVERDNIVIDGARYTVQGTGVAYSKGFYLFSINGVTIRRINIKGFFYGIQLWSSSYNTISENNITNNNYAGVQLFKNCNYNSISGNNITNNTNYGVEISLSNYNTVSRNNITNNSNGVMLSSDLYHTATANVISGNTIINNNWAGVWFSGSGDPYKPLSENILSKNTIANNSYGVYLLDQSNYNSISGNNIANNSYGVGLWYSSNNKIYHNNFIENDEQVYSYYSYTIWDDGFPSGGNYWSDYNGTDFYSGPYQNETGGDGIGDDPYVIDDYNQDNYPLTNPWTPAPPTLFATADIVPNTLNLKSEGKWITCYIELPEGYSVSDIDVSTVMLNETIPVSLLDVPAPEPVPTEIGDYDNDGIPDLMIKFNRTALTSHIYYTLDIKYGNVTLTITGELSDGTTFEGKDIVKVIFGGDADLSELVELLDFYIWTENFGNTPEKCLPDVHPDFDNNKLVEMEDFYIWTENFGATTPPKPPN